MYSNAILDGLRDIVRRGHKTLHELGGVFVYGREAGKPAFIFSTSEKLLEICKTLKPKEENKVKMHYSGGARYVIERVYWVEDVIAAMEKMERKN